MDKPKAQILRPEGIESAEAVMAEASAIAYDALSPMEKKIADELALWEKKRADARDWLDSQPTPEAREKAKLEYKNRIREAASARIIAIKAIRLEFEK